MKKSIGVISSRIAMSEHYAQIIRKLMGDFAEVHACSAEEGSLNNLPSCDIYVSSITNYDIMLDTTVMDYLPDSSAVVNMDLSFSKSAIDLLRTYPEGTKAFLLNQNKHMTMECIAQLYHLGISNIEFTPSYPGSIDPEGIDLLFTVGEPDLVCEGKYRIIDIGSRYPSVNTLAEIAIRLGNSFFLESDRFRKYRTRLARVDNALLKISSERLTTENKLEIILNSLNEGIVCIDETGKVTLINKEATELLSVRRSDVINHQVEKVLPMLPFKEKEDNISEPILLNISGKEIGVVINSIKIENQNLGAFAALHEFNTSEKQQNSLRIQRSKKRFGAKNEFSDIIGGSPEIEKIRNLARTMAKNDAPILLEGGSGSGKTVFAQAIHNASLRNKEAFVTVNCYSVTDELLKTELFGCVEGYNGNRKAQTGLIELAHRGTLYLEGIDAMNPGLQASLLGALRAREVTRLGSDESIPVDIRIISSTSQDLLQKVQEGTFLKDLYYILNVIPIRIPNLKDRRLDIPDLIRYFSQQIEGDFELTAQAKKALFYHRWEGNVRELRNCISYLKYTGLHTIDLDDLPENIDKNFHDNVLQKELKNQGSMKLPEYWVLKELGEVYMENGSLGRKAISDRCMAHGHAVSEHDVREILKKLKTSGLIFIGAGRGGTRLTEEGYLQYRRFAYGEVIDQ